MVILFLLSSSSLLLTIVLWWCCFEHWNRVQNRYVEYLVAGTNLPPNCAPMKPPPLAVLSEVPADSGAFREACAWSAVQGALDAYAQRCSAAEDPLQDVYQIMLDGGARVVERYLTGAVANRQQQQQQQRV